MNNYQKFLEDNYNMKSNITLENYLECLASMDVVDVYSIDAETNEEYFDTLGKDDASELDDTQKAYKVVRILNGTIVIYKEWL